MDAARVAAALLHRWEGGPAECVVVEQGAEPPLFTESALVPLVAATAAAAPALPPPAPRRNGREASLGAAAAPPDIEDDEEEDSDSGDGETPQLFQSPAEDEEDWEARAGRCRQ